MAYQLLIDQEVVLVKKLILCLTVACLVAVLLVSRQGKDEQLQVSAGAHEAPTIHYEAGYMPSLSEVDTAYAEDQQRLAREAAEREAAARQAEADRLAAEEEARRVAQEEAQRQSKLSTPNIAPAPMAREPRPTAPYADAAECTRAHEGWYTANTGNGYYGAYQFLLSTWNSTVSRMGRADLVGVLPSNASPADQDAAFWFLWAGGSGAGHWGYRCTEYA